MQKENGEITHELDRLRKENDGNLRKLKEAKAAASAFTEKIYTLETELSSAKPQAEQLRQTVSQLNAELAEFAALKSSTAQLQQELSQLKSERSQLEHKVANQELVLRSSTESTVVIDQRSKALEIELEKLRRECEAERVTREQFKSQLDTKAHSDEIRSANFFNKNNTSNSSCNAQSQFIGTKS